MGMAVRERSYSRGISIFRIEGGDTMKTGEIRVIRKYIGERDALTMLRALIEAHRR